VHSLSDLFSDAATILTVRLSRMPPDAEHPYGHGRYEHVGALSVSGLLGISGAAIAWHSYEQVLVEMVQMEASSSSSAAAAAAAALGAGAEVAAASAPVPMQVAAAVAFGSILAKELLYHETVKVAKRVVRMHARAWLSAMVHRVWTVC
jgi:divalent metal cation (Fe/Co/Zn/Cd) transporter